MNKKNIEKLFLLLGAIAFFIAAWRGNGSLAVVVISWELFFWMLRRGYRPMQSLVLPLLLAWGLSSLLYTAFLEKETLENFRPLFYSTVSIGILGLALSFIETDLDDLSKLISRALSLLFISVPILVSPAARLGISTCQAIIKRPCLQNVFWASGACFWFICLIGIFIKTRTALVYDATKISFYERLISQKNRYTLSIACGLCFLYGCFAFWTGGLYMDDLYTKPGLVVNRLYGGAVALSNLYAFLVMAWPAPTTRSGIMSFLNHLLLAFGTAGFITLYGFAYLTLRP